MQKIMCRVLPFSVSFLTLSAYAGIPVWMSEATGNGAKITVTDTEVKTVSYVVSNNSQKTKQLLLRNQQGISSTGCEQLLPYGTCLLEVTITGNKVPVKGIHGGPVLCQVSGGTPNAHQCYQPAKAQVLDVSKGNNPTTPLAFNTDSLLLAQQGILSLGAGVNQNTCENIFESTWVAPTCESKARVLTLTNQGNETIANVSFEINPALPAGTTMSPSTCTNLAPQASCQLTITPGAAASGPAGSAPQPSQIMPVINNQPLTTVSAEITVLTYGHLYQGGYLFAIQDLTSGIIGTVAAPSDQATGINWGASPSPVWGIDNSSTMSVPSPNASSIPPANLYSGQTNCNGEIDGLCNTNNISIYFVNNPSTSAAQICKDLTEGNYSNWYLPAICELSVNSSFTPGSGCGPMSAPLMQNISKNLAQENIGGFAFALYASSTEAFYNDPPDYVYDPSTQVWISDVLGGVAGPFLKTNNSNVRCVRRF